MVGSSLPQKPRTAVSRTPPPDRAGEGRRSGLPDAVAPWNPEVSVVLPVFNEYGNLRPLCREIVAAFQDIRFEIVTVDDGSTDESLSELQQLAAEIPHLRVIALGRRVGQSGALATGFDASHGEVIVTMDADGQNVPRDALVLLEAYRQAAGPVAAVGVRTRRADGLWRRIQSRVAKMARERITGDRVADTGCSLKVMPRDALRCLPRFGGMHRFLPTLLKLDGHAIIEIPVSHRPRTRGTSKYGALNRVVGGLRDAVRVRRWRRRTTP